MYFHDFGTGEMYDAVGVVMRKFNCNYHQAVDQIKKDRDLFTKTTIKEQKQSSVIDIVEAPLSDYDFYWKKFHIPIAIAAKYAVAVKSVYINETYSSRSTKSNPIFAYRFPSGNIKLYRPLSVDRAKK